MDKRYLLYIDILGFSELIKSEERTRYLYKKIDSLNAHKHSVFQTIVFSDTILVYNKKPAQNKKEAEYIVWYATEFAEDLHFRLVGENIYFRAMLTFGEFDHYHLENTECFFGQALVDAYNSEKHIPSTGLFMDNECQKLNRYFKTREFDNNWHFVYLERNLQYLKDMMYSGLPIRPEVIGDGEGLAHIVWALKYLQDINRNMRNDYPPKVRVKYLTTWDFYHREYPEILDYLLENDFCLKSISPKYDWTEKQSHYDNYYG